MKLLAFFQDCVKRIRDFLAPSYHPERHYMRGPGPASMRRQRAV